MNTVGNMNTNDGKLKEVFLYGEIFELAAYIGIASACQKHGISLLAYGEITESTGIDLVNWLDFTDQLDKVYGYTFEELRHFILNLKPLNESISIPDHIPAHQEELKTIIEIAIERNVKDRQSFQEITEQDKLSAFNEMLVHPNDMNTILLLSSGYSTGICFVEWCLQTYNSGFTIIIESKLYEQDYPYPKKPDLMVVKENEIVLIGDLKSYVPFLQRSKTNMLKDALEQVSLIGLGSEFLSNPSISPAQLAIHVFVRRHNILLRYFKLLQYMEIVYENGDDDYKSQKLDGIILFPTKPVVLSTNNAEMIDSFRETLKKTITYNIRWYDKQKRVYDNYNIKDEVWNAEMIDLDFGLTEGDMYIETVPDDKGVKHYICNVKLDTGEPHYFEIGRPSDFPEGEENEMNTLLPPRKSVSGIKLTREIRNEHHDYLLKKLQQDIGDSLYLLIDASDQGTGKNYTFAAYIKSLIDKKIDKTILFASPRKDAIIQTVLALQKHVQFSNQPVTEIVNELNETGSFTIPSFTIRYIKSGIKPGRVVSDHGYPKKIFDKSGEGATTRFNQFLNDPPASGVTLVFVTAQTLPTVVRQRTRKKTRRSVFKNIYTVFDLVVFDELSNSDPAVREAFCDLIISYQKLKQKEELEGSSRLLVLDASLTSHDLLNRILENIIGDKKEYFLPFWEEIREYPGDPILADYQYDYVSAHYFRYQLDYPNSYGVTSIGWSKKAKVQALPVDRLMRELASIIQKVQKRDANYPDLDYLLENNQVIFYADNKFFINDLNVFLKTQGYNVAISIKEQKEREFYETANVIGTSSLAFGTTFPNKRLLVVIPYSKGVDYFQYRQNVELIRQATKRMRGQEVEPHRLVCLVSFPTETHNETLEANVRMSYYMLQNSVNEFLTHKCYHQIPSFSSRLNSRNWLKDLEDVQAPIDSIYATKGFLSEEKRNLTLEEYLGDELPKVRILLDKWGVGISESFQIGFDAEKIRYLPIPNYICFPLDSKRFSLFFKVLIFPSSGVNSLNLLKSYLTKPFDTISDDLSYFYDLCRVKKTGEEDTAKKGLHLLHDMIKEVELKEKDPKKALKLFITKLNNLVRIINLPLSGTAFLLTFDLGDKPSQMISKGMNIVQARAVEKDEYLRVLWEIGSPLKSLYFGASDYFETPLMVKFQNKDIQTVGFLCHYPRFHDHHYTQPFYQLLKICLIKELFRENVIYLPNLLKDTWN
ncbi:MAG: hypothetical protein ACFFD4_31900 [Candidatus Odinarchaeota archaeon]